jgi:hypothetical protein
MTKKNSRYKKQTPQTGAPIRYTIPPFIYSQIVLKTLPGGICKLYREDEKDSEQHLKLFADQSGNINFHVRPSSASEEVARIIIESEANNKVISHVIELRPSLKPTPEMPFPTAELTKPRKTRTSIRPALSEKQMLNLSDEELAKRRYPPRPSSDQTSKAFNNWRRAVSTPAVYLKPQTIARSDISHGLALIQHGPATSNNWSGFELRGAGPYAWVTGKWNVPHVTGEANTKTYSAFWVGLDGDGTTDLVQAGTEQENFNIDFFFFRIDFSTYYAWTEFLPQQPTEQQITNFPINPGDEIFVEVYVANAGGSPDLNGFFGQFWVENLSNNHFTIVYTPRGTTVVGGSEAVWIMERPTVNGSLPDLADYNSAIMFDAYARRNKSARHAGYVPYQGDTNLQITMMNGSDSLSTVSAIDAYSMRFSWKDFH